jgi:hypothetical protein
MAGGGGTVLARGEEAAAFKTGRKAVGGASLCAKATKLRCGPRHGRSTVEGAATCGGRRANGGAWEARRGQRARTTWLGQGPTNVMHRDQGVRRTDRWMLAGLDVRVRPVRRHADTSECE